MRRVFGALMLVAALAATQTVTVARAAPPAKSAKSTKSTDQQTLVKIKAYRNAGEQKLVDNKFTRREVVLQGEHISEAIKQKWVKMDAYYEGDKLVRIQLYPHPSSERTEEFYLIDNQLVFAFIQDKGPKHEGKDMGEAGKELYFDHGRLITLDDRSGEPVLDAKREWKMYEAVLPYEVDQLVGLLKSTSS